MNICDFLKNGKENAITRRELVSLLNLPDRTVRRLIQEARDRGEIIINAQDGVGYYMTEDLGEMKRQLATNYSRSLSIMRQQVHLRNKIREIEQREQMTIEEVSNG